MTHQEPDADEAANIAAVWMRKVEFQGHTYIVYIENGLVHDPDCLCQVNRVYKAEILEPSSI